MRRLRNFTPDRRRYVFNSAGRLASVSTWNGTRVTMVRESPTGPVVRAEHSDGKALSFTYADGRFVRVDSPDPAVYVELAYAAHGAWHVLARVVRHDGPRVSTNDYSYVSIPSPGTRVSPLDPTHPRILPVLPRPSNGGATAALRPVLREKTDANGLSARFCYIRPGDSQTVRCAHMEMDGGLFSTSLSYGKNFTQERRSTAFGVSAMRFEYDARMRETLRRTSAETTTRTYDAHDDLVCVETVNAETGGRLVRTAQYDSRHRPVLVSSSLGTTRTAPATAYAWDDVRGIPSRIVSPEGRVFAWTTNGCDMTVFGAGTNDARLVTGISCTTNGRPHAITGPDGDTTVLTYGGDGLVSRIDSSDLPSVGLSRDALGHVTAITDPGPDGSVRTTHFTVNGRGRPLMVSHPDGTSESFAYDGNGTRVVRHVDALGREDVYKWVLGLPIHAGRVTGGVTNALFSVSHDPQLNVIAIADPLGRPAESYVLDENERIVAVTNLEGQVLSRRYLVGDLVSSETRFDGTAVSYDYDASAILSSVTYPGDTLEFTRDNDGLLTSASNATGTVSNAYDSATGWLDSSVGADGTPVSYLHSDGGSVTAVVSVAGTTRHALDAAGRRIRTDSSSGSVRYGYCPWNGLVAAVTNVNGFTASYEYDAMNRVTNITWRTASGVRLGGFGYEYDAAGRIVSRAHSLGTNRFDRAYAYDSMDRLAADGDVAYSYDAAGNRTTRTEDGEAVTYTLGQGDRLASWTGGSYEHDTAGCVTKIVRGSNTWNLAWNGQYQLVSVSTNGVFAESYAYDALGRRTSTTNAEGTERHVYDDSWQVIADLDSNGNVLRSYVWGEGIDRLVSVKIGTRVYTALTDVQGTVWGYADEQGAIVARWTYDAWGDVLSEEIAPSASVLRKVRYRFQGRERSAATGLVNFRMRWYDAATGRWLSKDPIGLGGGLSLFEFCCNDAVNGRDPIGWAKVKYRPLDVQGSEFWQKICNLLSHLNLIGDIDPRHAEIFFR